MLNTTPLNTSELNAPGLSAEIVELDSAVAVNVTASQPTIERIIGLGATSVVAVTPSADATRGQTMRATSPVIVSSVAGTTQDKQFAAVGAVSVTGIMGLSLPKEMAATADVAVAGTLYAEAVLFSTVSVDVTQTAYMGKVEALAGTGAVAVTSAESSVFSKPLAVAADVVVDGIADPDFEVGGALVVGLSGRPGVNVTSAAALDPTLVLGGAGAVLVEGGVATMTITYGLFSVVPVVVEPIPADLQVFTGGIASGSNVVVSGDVAMLKYSYMRAAATVTVAGTPRLGAIRQLTSAATSVNVTSAVAMVRRSGMRTVSPVVVTASAPEVILGTRLEAIAEVNVTSFAAPIYYTRKNLSTDAQVAVTSTVDPVYFTRRNLAVEATVTVGGVLQTRAFLSLASIAPVVVGSEALVRTNLFSTEPDYRTLVVDFEEFTVTVEPQEFTVIVTTDSVPMQTFTKQPTEILPYDIDFAEWIAGITGGDEVESATCTVVTASSGLTTALTIDSVLLVTDTQRFKVWVSGGTNGVTYKLTLVMLTEAGRRKEVDFRIKIKET